ncbi:MAG: corrinoid protein-associated methyltransferase CpaM [Fidelibacterota bacterium]
MSTYVLMKILESAPGRYDRGIRILTLGKLDRVYDRLVSHIDGKQKVLDIGCGTGTLSLKAAQRGATVKGIDPNAQMLEVARKRVDATNFPGSVELSEMGVAELSGEISESYDAVVSGLCFSELSNDEITYTLQEVKRILKPGGLLLIADEAKPERMVRRFLSRFFRFPLVVITYLLTQTTTHAVRDLPGKVLKMGFDIESIKFNRLGNFLELMGKKPGGL